MTSRTERTLTARDLIDGYLRSYYTLYQRKPSARYIGSCWYQINGEIVHRNTLMQEVMRMRREIRRQHRVSKNVVQRLIAKLRAL